MKLKNVTALATALAGESESEISEKDKTLLKRCANIVIKEIATEFAPVYFTESFDSNSVPLNSLTYPLIEIKEITDKNGNDIVYKIDGGVIKTETPFTLRYSYVPKDLIESDEIPLGNNKITSSALAFGVLCEYYLVKGRFDEAVIFNGKYLDAVKRAVYKKGKRLAERSFV